MDRGAWWVAVQGVAQSQTRLKRLSTPAHSTCQTCRAAASLFLAEETSLRGVNTRAITLFFLAQESQAQ